MSCDGCSSRLKKMLEKHPDVDQAEVDHENGYAMITGIISHGAASETVDKAGFRVVQKEN